MKYKISSIEFLDSNKQKYHNIEPEIFYNSLNNILRVEYYNPNNTVSIKNEGNDIQTVCEVWRRHYKVNKYRGFIECFPVIHEQFRGKTFTKERLDNFFFEMYGTRLFETYPLLKKEAVHPPGIVLFRVYELEQWVKNRTLLCWNKTESDQRKGLIISCGIYNFPYYMSEIEESKDTLEKYINFISQ